MKNYEDIGVQIPQVYLPKNGVDLTKWATIACDQFTSQPEYWEAVERFVGDAPSTLQLILPEAYINCPDREQRMRRIQANMRAYLEQGLLESHQGIIYVERTSYGRTRRGIMLALDLERYEFSHRSSALIRPTEDTIVERIHPRVQIRRGAALELPHILVLIDDPARTVIEPLSHLKHTFPKLYDFDLMFDSGHLTGYLITPNLEESLISAIRCLANPKAFAERYGLSEEESVLLFAVGDGNHSLATAKAVWEQIRSRVDPHHPARYALVEVENLHDDGLIFEPIHRVLFNLRQDIYTALEHYFGDAHLYHPVNGIEEMTAIVASAYGHEQIFGLISGGKYGVVTIKRPSSSLTVGTLQTFLDSFLQENGAEGIDYVHGEDVIIRFGDDPANAAFYLPAMEKSDLFKTVILDGVLPRKTFSMGEAKEKRFYLEARNIALPEHRLEHRLITQEIPWL